VLAEVLPCRMTVTRKRSPPRAGQRSLYDSVLRDDQEIDLHLGTYRVAGGAAHHVDGGEMSDVRNASVGVEHPTPLGDAEQ
jgi:hypothetical protein